MIIRHFLFFFLLVSAVQSGSLVDRIMEEMEFVAMNILKIGDPRDVSSVFELAEVAVEEIERIYGILIYDLDDNFVLQKELVQLHSSSKEKQDEVLAGFPSNFKAVPRLLKELKRAEKVELAKLNEEDKEALKEGGLFVHYMIRGKPLAKILKDRLGNEEYMKMTREERKKIIAAKRDRLMRYWSGGQQIILEEIAKGLGIEDFEAFGRGELDMNGEKIVNTEL
ncbi:hypothetical protein PENTCL1PPCAC_5957 [Pristionchus entomophagus]|uniref:Uncharacterized protein n=1 Tax=Pristionchus entomophagus TaxID=358040 RepID=A0AAV5SM54_9BILA|nr:hypothetical protein PENTCL1PPCAC_5957 [Pristionchus entomophagus]